MKRRQFLRGMLAGAASVAIGLRMSHGAPKVTDGAGKIYDWRDVKLGYTITSEEIDEGLYGEVGERMARALAKSLMETREIATANVLNRAFG